MYSITSSTRAANTWGWAPRPEARVSQIINQDIPDHRPVGMAVAGRREVRDTGLSQHLRKGKLQDSAQEIPEVSTDIKELCWSVYNTCLEHKEI